MDHTQRVICVCAGLAMATGFEREAAAIITRHDVSDSQYVVDDADYPAVVDLFEPGDCIGTLIHARFLLTVAHCAEDLSAAEILCVNGVDLDVEEVFLHPNWSGFDDDIALIELSESVEGVTPVPVYRGTAERGEQLTLVGRGLHGTGLQGESGASQDTQLRRATNIVTDTDDQWIEVYFEEPGENGVTDLEGVGAAGDSGGPAFIETSAGVFLAGLNSWGDGDGFTGVGDYGAWDYSTRVSQHLVWIDAVLEGDIEAANAVGEDSAVCGYVSTNSAVGGSLLLVLLGIARRRWDPESSSYVVSPSQSAGISGGAVCSSPVSKFSHGPGPSGRRWPQGVHAPLGRRWPPQAVPSPRPG